MVKATKENGVKNSTEWIVFCRTCNKELDRANNGNLMQALLNIHIKETGHTVLLGLEFSKDGE